MQEQRLVYVRFVGGPWHNRVEQVKLTTAIILRSKQGIPCGIKTIYKDELYHLAQFETGLGTKYYQYVHSSMVHGQTVEVRAYRERLPRLKFNGRKFLDRLRRAMK